MADMGTDAMEREKTFLFASAEGRLLYSVTEALRRLYRNEYGVCGSCGKDIGKARLEAIPHASLCVSCQEKQERETNAARG
jgi:RNA polymerase-binding transcription factor DksA